MVMMEVREHADMTRAVHRLRENVSCSTSGKRSPLYPSLSIGYDLISPPCPANTIHIF